MLYIQHSVLGVVDQVSTRLGDTLLFADLLSQAVGDCRHLVRNAHGQRGRASDCKKRSRGVDGESDRSERCRIEENGLATAVRWRVGPQRSVSRESRVSVDCVDGRINRPALVPDRSVIVGVREEIRVLLVKCHGRIVSAFQYRSSRVTPASIRTRLHMEGWL